MNFKTKIAYTAVLATLGLAAGSAQAAFLSEQGTGQALIYPYYTVQGDKFDTYITVVNTTTQAKAVKVRFLEAKNSYEVLDFNLYLSAKDWWGGAVTTVAGDAAKAAKLISTDKSCTDPLGPFTGVDFRNVQYKNDIFADASLARTREGYVEIIEMGPITDAAMAANVTHINGTPKDCKAAQLMNASHLGAPTGGLIGTGTLINGPQGTDYSYDPVALDDLFETQKFSPAGSTLPTFSDAINVSTVIRRNPTTGEREVLTSQWGAAPTSPGVEGVSAVLMHNSVMNEYVLEPTLKAATDWVVTFPTKHMHYGERITDIKPTPPFTSTLTVNGACESVTLASYDREEGIGSPTSDFSPKPPADQQGLCYEANVITFGKSELLSSALTKNTNISPYGINGWTDMTFAGGQKMTNNNTTVNGGTAVFSATYHGLPAVGFALIGLKNEALTPGVLSVYGGSYIHKYTSDITVQ
jgi:hypothetical protein